MKEQCGACKFFKDDFGGKDTRGVCRRFPPIASGAVPNENELMRFAWVEYDGWCGEFCPAPRDELAFMAHSEKLKNDDRRWMLNSRQWKALKILKVVTIGQFLELDINRTKKLDGIGIRGFQQLIDFQKKISAEVGKFTESQQETKESAEGAAT